VDPVRGVLMVIEVVLTHVSKSCGQSEFKKGSYLHCKAMGKTGFQGVKQHDVNYGHLNPVQSSC
jgi:hypothetical protein